MYAEAVLRLHVARTADGVLEATPPAVRVDELGHDDIVLEVTFWTDSRRADYKNTASAVREAIVASFKAAGIGLPEPDVRLLQPRKAEEWQKALAPTGQQPG